MQVEFIWTLKEQNESLVRVLERQKNIESILVFFLESMCLTFLFSNEVEFIELGYEAEQGLIEFELP